MDDTYARTSAIWKFRGKGRGGYVAGNFNWKLFARWCTRFDLEVGLCNRVGAGADLVFEGYKRCYKFLKRDLKFWTIILLSIFFSISN